MLAHNSFALCKCEVRDVAAKAADELKSLYEFGLMSPGKFVKGGSDISGKQRDDITLYLSEYVGVAGHPELASAGQLTMLDQALTDFGRAVIDCLTTLKGPYACSSDERSLHHTGSTDVMLSCYPGKGAAYGAHIDNRDGDGRAGLDLGRCFALVYYLNKSWNSVADGGALRLHLPDDAAHCAPFRRARVVVDVAPEINTLVMFRADKLVHEVRPTYGVRFAATKWFFAGEQPPMMCTR